MVKSQGLKGDFESSNSFVKILDKCFHFFKIFGYLWLLLSSALIQNAEIPWQESLVLFHSHVNSGCGNAWCGMRGARSVKWCGPSSAPQLEGLQPHFRKWTCSFFFWCLDKYPLQLVNEIPRGPGGVNEGDEHVRAARWMSPAFLKLSPFVPGGMWSDTQHCHSRRTEGSLNPSSMKK